MLSFSVDSVHSHKVWQETELSKMVDGGVPFPMLSDAGGKIGEMTGLDRKVVDKAMDSLKKTGAIESPVRCKWQPKA